MDSFTYFFLKKRNNFVGCITPHRGKMAHSHEKYGGCSCSFFILIKMAEQYLQAFSSIEYQNLEDLYIFSVPLDTS